MKITDEVIEDNVCNGSCKNAMLVKTESATQIGDNFCASAGCEQATSVANPANNLVSIGDGFC
jgi:hypothetical protein